MNYTSLNEGKKTKKEINYLKRSEFESGDILGETTLRQKRKRENCDTLNEKYAVQSHLFGYTLGYIKVQDNGYLRYKTRIPIILLFFSFLIALLLLFFPQSTSPRFNTIQGEPINTTKNPEPEQNTEMTTVSGHSTQIITKANPYVFLINDKANDVYFQYDLINEATQEIVVSTDAFPPDSMIKVNMREYLQPGEYSFTFHFKTYDIETKEACSSGNEKSVKIIIQ